MTRLDRAGWGPPRGSTMPLLNYTTTVDAAKTVGEIQRHLARRGARGVMVEYDAARRPSAVAFVVATAFGDRTFRLPANLAAVHKTLRMQATGRHIPPRLATEEQAARVGWRIVKDWVEAQMAIVESGMVTMDEVFLPYMLDGKDRTFYQVVRDQQLALPALTGRA